MTEQLYAVSKRSPAALNRYIYYPDRLVRLPGPEPNAGALGSIWRGLTTLLTEPLFESAIGAFLREPIRDARTDQKDESIGAFVSRRLNPKMADNLVSAVFHGIFAGDIYKLSAQTIMGAQHVLEKEHDSVTAGIVANMQEKKRVVAADHLLATWSVEGHRPPGHFDRLRGLLRPVSVFALKDGVAEIARLMAKKFEEKSHKITVVTDADIKAIKREENHDITVRLDLQLTEPGYILLTSHRYP
jgi:protoporphyrinogen/coproporphyrinogen III oxidase